MSAVLFSPAEARAVAALVEKSLTTPAYYPMTVNGLVAACNQKSSREPVMNLSEGEVGHALSTLEEKGFASRDTMSSRATKWRHKFQHQLLLKPATQAVLTTLMLRGPQTLAELRANAAPLGGPADAEALVAALADLADRAQPLVVSLARASGQSASRYAHTLCGEPEAATAFAAEAVNESAARLAPGTAERINALEARILALEARLAGLEQQLGVATS